MTIAKLQSAFQNFLSDLTRIDAWGIEEPINLVTMIDGEAFPANSAIALPVRELEFQHTGTRIEGTATFEFMLAYRYFHKLNIEALPMGYFQELVEFLNTQVLLLTRLPTSDQLLRATLAADSGLLEVLNGFPNPKPAIISKIEGENGDWLLVGSVRFRCRFESVPDLSVIPQIPAVEAKLPQSIQAAIWRSPLDKVGDQSVSSQEHDGAVSI